MPDTSESSTSVSERERRLSRLLGRELSGHAVDAATGWTDLHYAAALDLPQVARRLLDAGMNADVRLKEGKEPLGERLLETLGKMLGREIKVKHAQGDAPLHWAKQSDAIEFVRWLVKRGADIHAKDNNGGTPFDVVGLGAWTKTGKSPEMQNETRKLLRSLGGRCATTC